MAATNKQKEIQNNFKSESFEMVFSALNKAQKAKDAIVKLPYKNEDGESVLHHDNVSMITIEETYRQQAMIFVYFLSKEEENQIQISFPNWRST